MESKQYIELFTVELTLVFNIRRSNNINEIFISCFRKNSNFCYFSCNRIQNRSQTISELFIISIPKAKEIDIMSKNNKLKRRKRDLREGEEQ